MKKAIYSWDELPIILRAGDVASLMGLSEQHTRRLMAAGMIPAKQIGRRWYVNRETLRDVIEGRAGER